MARILHLSAKQLWLHLWISYVYLTQILVLGKVEGHKNDNAMKDWHGHVTAVTVAPIARRQGIARYLMDYLEQVTHKM